MDGVVVVAVPFRPQEGFDRPGQLARLVARLAEVAPRARVVVARQTDDGRPFNRGAVLNAAFAWARSHVAGLAFFIAHDCDLLPDAAAAALYAEPRPFVCLAARPGCRYAANPRFVGGVTGFTPEAFEAMNGFPVNFWGWGGEDDEMRRRAERVGVRVERNTDVGDFEDLEGLTVAQKLAWLRQHRDQKNMRKWELEADHASTWARNGLNLEPRVLEARRDGGVDRLLVRPA